MRMLDVMAMMMRSNRKTAAYRNYETLAAVLAQVCSTRSRSRNDMFVAQCLPWHALLDGFLGLTPKTDASDLDTKSKR